MASIYDFIDRDVVDAYLENDPDILQGKLELAGEAVDYARSIAPEDKGDYKDGIKVRRYGRSGVGINFTDEISNIIEYGSEDTPEFAVRARTIEHFGGAG